MNIAKCNIFVFADESAFPLQSHLNNKEWQTLSTQKKITKKLYNPFVHVWGAISFVGKTELEMLKCKEK